MADKKISELSAAATLDGTEQVPVTQSGTTVRTTTENIAAYVVTNDGAPTDGRNQSFTVHSIGVGSGTFKLLFESVTTAALDGVTATSTDIANAMNTAYGSTIAQAYPTYETVAVPDFAVVQFIGTLGGMPVTVPTVVDDTTDGVVETAEDQLGIVADPPGVVGLRLLDTTNLIGYEFVGEGVWEQVWPGTQIIAHDGTPATSSASVNGLSVTLVARYDGEDTDLFNFQGSNNGLDVIVKDHDGSPVGRLLMSNSANAAARGVTLFGGDGLDAAGGSGDDGGDGTSLRLRPGNAGLGDGAGSDGAEGELIFFDGAGVAKASRPDLNPATDSWSAGEIQAVKTLLVNLGLAT